MPSLLQLHIDNWGTCNRCYLHETRKTVVLGRGKIPCDILFIGEAPGESENILGKPFCGVAGKLLDQIIAQALPDTMTYALTNLIACIPRGGENGKVEPQFECIRACAPRLQEFIYLCHPKLIVCVGALARDWLDQKRRYHVDVDTKIPQVDITHPAAILRVNLAQRGLMVQRCVVAIRTAIEDLEDAK